MGFLANTSVLEQCLRSQLSQCQLRLQSRWALSVWLTEEGNMLIWSQAPSCIFSGSRCIFSDSRRLYFRYVERDYTRTALGYGSIVKASSNPTEPWNNTILQFLIYSLAFSLISTAVIWALCYLVPQKHSFIPLEMVQLCNSLCKVTAREGETMSREPLPRLPCVSEDGYLE